MAELVIELEHIALKFGRQTIHRDINFGVHRGEVITLLGPSGTGKTLILKMIMGLIPPSGGRIKVFGQDVVALSDEELRAMRLQVGMLFQGAALFDSMTVAENIGYSLRESEHLPEDQIKEVVAKKLELVGLPGIEKKVPAQLSGGQRKRVGLARALASDPKIMLFDEPTTGLDPTASRLIDDLIISLNQEHGMTVMAVTHDIASAKRISDRWVLINNGYVAADGAVADVTTNSPEIKDFIGGNWTGEMHCE